MTHNVERYRRIFRTLSPEEIAASNRRDREEHERQVVAFRAAYAEGGCYLCGEKFERMNTSHPCTHWLLRRCKFKKRDFPAVVGRYDYINIAAFLRWCANEEAFLRNINDLKAERSNRKVLSYTIKWKNIEWTFDCTKNDLTGHGGGRSSIPHYHFQMRIDGHQFINFNDFHVPFSDRDLFQLSLRDEPWIHQDFGAAGAGMQEAVSVDPEKLLEHMVSTQNEEEAPYHLSTIIDATDAPISGEELRELMQEARRTNKSFAYVAKQRLEGKAIVCTVISPNDSVPKISARTARKPR